VKIIEKIIAYTLLGATVYAAWGYAELYNRAPDTLPGILPEMRNSSYWIARMKNPDEVILTPDVIQRMNGTYEMKMKVPDPFKGVDPDRVPKRENLYKWSGRFITMPAIYNMTSAQIASIVREEISKDIDFMRGKYILLSSPQIADITRKKIGKDIDFMSEQYLQNVPGLPENFEGQKYGNILGIEYADWELDDMEKEMAIDLVRDKITIHDGITIRDARLRIIPTIKPEHIGLNGNWTPPWDVWNVNIVRIGTPVTVLHTSKTGGYLFVLSNEGYGWIRSEDIAFGEKTEIGKFSDPTDFVVCTGDRVPFYTDENCRYVSGWFRMGDRLPLASKDNPRIINAPSRKMNGRFEVEQAWLAKDADVHVGYLPYTRRNIVITAFKLLDNIYDWTMGWYGRNHETTSRDIFACFGFNLPFNAELFTFFGNNTRVVHPEEGKEAQYRAILANEPFITIQTCVDGHNQLFLGEYNGEPIVLDAHGYGYHDKGGTWCEIKRLVVGNMSQPDYFLKTNFTFLELK